MEHAPARLRHTEHIGSFHCRRGGVRLMRDNASPDGVDIHLAPSFLTHGNQPRYTAAGDGDGVAGEWYCKSGEEMKKDCCNGHTPWAMLP